MRLQWWRAESERLLREIAPCDFEGLPIYLVTRDEVDGMFDNDCNAWTSSFLDLRLREHLETTGRWAGRGFAAIISEGRIRSQCRKVRGPLVSESLVDRCLVNVVLHEASHYFQDGHNDPLLKPLNEWSPALRSALEVLLQPATTSPPEKQTPEPNGNPTAGHPPNFIRLAIHVVHRARVAGHSMHLSEIGAAGDFYKLSPIEAYAEALGDEPTTRIDDSLRDIAASPAPQPFVEFAAADFAKAESEH